MGAQLQRRMGAQAVRADRADRRPPCANPKASLTEGINPFPKGCICSAVEVTPHASSSGFRSATHIRPILVGG